MRRRNNFSFSNGFTVLEILLGLVIFSFIAAIVYNMFAMGIKLDAKTRRVHQWANETRLGLDLIARELENAFVLDVTGIDPEKSSFQGLSNRLGFLIPAITGVDAVEYYLGLPNFGERRRVLIGGNSTFNKAVVAKRMTTDTQQFLIRRRIPWQSFMKNSDEGVEEQVITPGLAAHGLRIRYSDGYQEGSVSGQNEQSLHWLDQWDNDGLPVAVNIEMTFVNGVVLNRVIVLPVAAAALKNNMAPAVNQDVSRHTVNVRYLDSIKEIKQ